MSSLKSEDSGTNVKEKETLVAQDIAFKKIPKKASAKPTPKKRKNFQDDVS